MAKQPKTNTGLTIDSKITEDALFLVSNFEKASPSKFKLLYRASENNFSAKQFHLKCDDIKDTMVLLRTEFGKVIGGYTSMTWNASKKHWAPDKSGSSFIFSVSLKEKYQLNLLQFAIACNPEKGPIFGCCDICIVDSSNVEKSNAEFPISYNSFNHSRNAATSEKFTGSNKGRFTIQ